jgi:hypothetical protein
MRFPPRTGRHINFVALVLFAMSLLPRLLATFALLALTFPSVLADSSDCKPEEFWYDNQSCCVPSYPPKTTPNPP